MKTETTVIKSKVLFSDDGEHRMLLRREWNRSGKSAMIIMINPSIADTICVDVTTMLVLNNLQKLGFGSVNIVNLYSRITEKLRFRFNSDDDLIAKECDDIIEQYAALSDAVIIAWGSVGSKSERVHERQKDILERLNKYKNKLYQIGEEGYHPLTPAVRFEWTLVPYEMEEENNAENNKS
ncbi:MAG: DUF1643 domain-containing protein [Oscillospiraceae bacterium]|nr:DUF1643 domain-containing protein [Oscillospiraceae bacterium]